MNKTVSVIIPSYNRADLVGDTIENMLRQSLPPHEVIVVDDGSTDRSAEVIKSFGDRVLLIQQANAGPGAARNAGLAAATGEFVQFMDSDDLASLNKLKVQSDALTRNDAEMAYGPWVQMEMNGRRVGRIDCVLQAEPVLKRLPLYELHLRHWALVLQSCMFSRSFLRRVGILKVDLLGTEDFEYLNRIFLACPKVVFTSECTVFYRLHDSGKLSGSGTTSIRKTQELARAYGYMAENISCAPEPLSLGTRFEFSRISWDLWRRLVSAGAAQSAEATRIRSAAHAFPRWLYRIAASAIRLRSALRARLTGVTWKSFYRARFIGSNEVAQMREAHLDLSQATDSNDRGLWKHGANSIARKFPRVKTSEA